MSKRIKLINNYYGFPLYKKDTLTVQQGLTILVGCNGIGKTTLLHQIKKYLETRKIPVIHFNNLKQGGQYAISQKAFENDFAFVATAYESSEGEEIFLNIGNFAKKIGLFVKKCVGKKEKTLFILADAIDSGLSVDNVVNVKKYLFDTILEDCKKKNIDVYIIVSSNEYELARNEKCLDVYNCEYISFNNYEQYREFIINSCKLKKLREKS